MLEEKCFYDYANKCDCSEDDKCSCTFPDNMPHNFNCPEHEKTKTFDQLRQSATMLREEKINNKAFRSALGKSQSCPISSEAQK